jgi:phytoene dehydrogenase-like protein
VAAGRDAVTGRRAFLASGAALLAGACTRAAAPVPPGELLGANHRLGHRLRDADLPAPGEERRARVVIVGAGIGGLSAAWRLHRAGFADYEILELEPVPGGNARWGENAVSAYPWGAHYVTLPTKEARAVRLLLSDLGVLEGDPEAAVPRYEERALCQAPQERLYRHGAWSEGLAPTDGLGAAELSEWQRFHERMQGYKSLRGRDGRRAFAVPIDQSSRDPGLLALDRITMAAWLMAEGFRSEAVRWFVDYACRDDYGCGSHAASAWAAIHYFACRTGAAHGVEADSVLTWPEGNGYLVKRLIERTRPAIAYEALVHRVEEEARVVRLAVYLARERRTLALRAEHVIWAAPLRFAARAFAGTDVAADLAGFEHAPWVVANLTLSEPPHVHHGAPLAWDNVLHGAESLGYVVATHQGVRTRPGPTVLTWYRPLAGMLPAEGRRKLLETSREHWARAALDELAKPHPEIGSITSRIDVFANGHAMVFPQPGLVWGEARARLLARRRRVHFAHADASGMSLFEEANDRGVAAAEAVLRALGGRVESLRA